MRRVDIEEYREIILSVLLRIDEICRSNDLKYMLMFGTLIGAIRHKGFIPWDDDIDIVMPRDDYYRLMRIVVDRDDLSFISVENNDDTIYPYGKVCDLRTELKEKNLRRVKGYGAFIDVFPLDYMPDSIIRRKMYCRKCRILIIWITHSSRTGYDPGSTMITKLSRALAFKIGRLMNTQKMVRKLDLMMTEFNSKHGKTSYMGLPWDYHADRLYPAELFEEVTEVEFEHHMLYAPKQFDTVLKLNYGDYMKLPPEGERVYAHSLECYIKD